MLRKALKRTKTDSNETSINTKHKVRPRSIQEKPLGSAPEKDEAEKVLEKMVLGDDGEILMKLEEQADRVIARKTHRQSDAKEKPQAVWEDEDDDKADIVATTENRGRQASQSQNLSIEQLAESRKNQFERVAGNPSWAKLKWQKSDSEGEGEADSDSEELLKSTGNYLAASQSLAKGIIQIDKCTDANKEAPSSGKLRSVEFHPSAQVILTAGMSQTLDLFQVDGKTNPKIQSVFLDKCPIFEAHFSTDGREVIMGSKHKSFCYYDMIAGTVVQVPWIKGIGRESMSRFQVSPDGKLLAFLGKDGHIHLLSAQSKEWISSLKMNGSVEAAAFTRDGSKMLSHGGDGEVYVWDMNARSCVHKFRDDGCIKGTTVTVSPNGQYIACGSYSGIVNVYDDTCLQVRDPRPLKAIMNLTTSCTSSVFNSTSEILALASNSAERAVKLVHLPSLTVFSNFPDKTDYLRIPMSQHFSLHSGYYSVADHKGQAHLYRVKHYDNY